MKKFLPTLLIAVALVLVPMSGCPPISGTVFVTPGHWSFELSTIAMPVSIVLLDGGTTAGVPGGPPSGSIEFSGTLTWMQMDETFTMNQSVGGGASVFEYTGTVFGPTYMEGSFQQTVGGSLSGIWTATFVP